MGSYVGSLNASRPQINRQKNNREEPKQKCRLGTAGGGGGGGWGGGGLQLVCGRPPSPLVLTWFLRHSFVRFAWKIPSS